MDLERKPLGGNKFTKQKRRIPWPTSSFKNFEEFTRALAHLSIAYSTVFSSEISLGTM